MSKQILLGLIPARSGSKGVPGKNIKPLGGKPLIAHTIEAALESGRLSRVIVDTDDAQIAETARGIGAETPWLRPPQLASDSSDIMDAVLLCLSRLEREGSYTPDAVVLLQPTSPFRSAATIRRGAELFAHSLGESIVSVSPVRDHPYWCKKVTQEGTLRDFLKDVEAPATRQQLPPAYVVDGLLYISAVAGLQTNRSFFSRRTVALRTPPEERLDIDTPADWEFAEFLAQRRFAGASRE